MERESTECTSVKYATKFVREGNHGKYYKKLTEYTNDTRSRLYTYHSLFHLYSHTHASRYGEENMSYLRLYIIDILCPRFHILEKRPKIYML